MSNGIETVAETPAFVLIYKPAGIAVESRDISAPDVYHMLLKKYGELYIINRLDQPVEGLVLFAKNRKSAAALSAALQDGRIKKEYLAVVSGMPEPSHGVLENMLAKDGKSNTSRVVPKGTSGAKPAHLEYKTLSGKEFGGKRFSLVAILLGTGRHHQIRVQFAHLGAPVAGDRKYGRAFAADEGRFPALCAYRLTFGDPDTGEEHTFEVLPKGRLFEIFYENGTVRS